jgi:hypothetical protein
VVCWATVTFPLRVVAFSLVKKIIHFKSLCRNIKLNIFFVFFNNFNIKNINKIHFNIFSIKQSI